MKVTLKEIYGYRRRSVMLGKDSVSLSPPPWQKGEQRGDQYVEEGREGMGVSSKQQAGRKRRGSSRV